MGRPSKKDKHIYDYRKKLMFQALDDGFNQSEVAKMFKVRRSTINEYVKAQRG